MELLKNENIVDLSEAELPTDMVEFIGLGDTGVDKATDYVESNITGISPEDITIKAPIKTPNKDSCGWFKLQETC